jgi:tripartite ATP-independent transporter DctM subunit
MAMTMLSVMLILLLAGFPMMMPLMVSTLIAFFFYLAPLNPTIIIQQMVGGVQPSALVAIPMFMFAADIITRGHSANRLVDLVMNFIGHIRGGLAITVAATCTLFGAVSGSTQATVVAVGGPMRPKMLKAGYNDSFTMALIINSSDIAFLIPPSIGMIVYGVLSGTSISELFIAGIGPGLLILLMFSIYSYIYATIKKIPTEASSTWKERFQAFRKAIWPLGFPVIIVGGIYGGIFSPTEAASICVAYAFILEVIIFRSIKIKEIADIALSTGIVTAVVFILIAAGAAFSWVLSYAQIPQELISNLHLDSASPVMLLITIALIFFVGCMFVDPIVVMLILIPILMPLVNASGLDPVLVGIMITLQVAIGSATPPFGCDIFTAIAIFRRPYIDVIKGTPPFVIMLLIASALLVVFPEIALFLRDLSISE